MNDRNSKKETLTSQKTYIDAIVIFLFIGILLSVVIACICKYHKSKMKY